MDANTGVCKICDREFANGKALGGHMRSHLAIFPLPAVPKPQPESPPTVRSANSEVSFIAASDLSVDHDHRDSDTESRGVIMNPDKPSGLQLRRSERSRRSASDNKLVPADAAEHVSSVSTSDLDLSDEDVAQCLLLLSVDNSSRGMTVKQEPREVADDEMESEDQEEAEDERDEFFGVKRQRTARAARSKFKCSVCMKVFRSYQALGGHRASHGHGNIPSGTRRINCRQISNPEKADQRDPAAGSNKLRLFKCPFCEKVFESGQGLGGHKKVHFSHAANKKKLDEISNNVDGCDVELTAPQNSSVRERIFIDLNLPAPPEDQQDEEGISEPQLATVSS